MGVMQGPFERMQPRGETRRRAVEEGKQEYAHADLETRFINAMEQTNFFALGQMSRDLPFIPDATVREELAKAERALLQDVFAAEYDSEAEDALAKIEAFFLALHRRSALGTKELQDLFTKELAQERVPYDFRKTIRRLAKCVKQYEPELGPWADKFRSALLPQALEKATATFLASAHDYPEEHEYDALKQVSEMYRQTDVPLEWEKFREPLLEQAAIALRLGLFRRAEELFKCGNGGSGDIGAFLDSHADDIAVGLLSRRCEYAGEAIAVYTEDGEYAESRPLTFAEVVGYAKSRLGITPDWTKPDIRAAAVEAMALHMSWNEPWISEEISKETGIPLDTNDERIREGIQESYRSSFARGDVYSVETLLRDYGVPIRMDNRMREAMESGFAEAVKKYGARDTTESIFRKIRQFDSGFFTQQRMTGLLSSAFHEDFKNGNMYAPLNVAAIASTMGVRMDYARPPLEETVQALFAHYELQDAELAAKWQATIGTEPNRTHPAYLETARKKIEDAIHFRNNAYALRMARKLGLVNFRKDEELRHLLDNAYASLLPNYSSFNAQGIVDLFRATAAVPNDPQYAARIMKAFTRFLETGGSEHSDFNWDTLDLLKPFLARLGYRPDWHETLKKPFDAYCYQTCFRTGNFDELSRLEQRVLVTFEPPETGELDWRNAWRNQGLQKILKRAKPYLGNLPVRQEILTYYSNALGTCLYNYLYDIRSKDDPIRVLFDAWTERILPRDFLLEILRTWLLHDINDPANYSAESISNAIETFRNNGLPGPIFDPQHPDIKVAMQKRAQKMAVSPPHYSGLVKDEFCADLIGDEKEQERVVLNILETAFGNPSRLPHKLKAVESAYGIRPDWSSPDVLSTVRDVLRQFYMTPGAYVNVEAIKSLVPQPVVLSEAQCCEVATSIFHDGRSDADWWQFVGNEIGIRPDFADEKTRRLWHCLLWRTISRVIMVAGGWDKYEQLRAWSGEGLEEFPESQVELNEMVSTLKGILSRHAERTFERLQQALGWNPFDEDKMEKWLPSVNSFNQLVMFRTQRDHLTASQKDVFIALMRIGLENHVNERSPSDMEIFFKEGVIPSAAFARKRIVHECLTKGEVGPQTIQLFARYGLPTTIEAADLTGGKTDLALRQAALFYQQTLPKICENRKAAERAFRNLSPRYDLVADLLAIKGTARRAEFCPYQKELPMLLDGCTTRGHGPDQEPVKAGIIEFVRRFGLRNLPELARAVIDAKNCDDPDEQKAVQNLANASKTNERVRQAMDLLGVKPTDGLSPRAFLDRLERFRNKLLEDILTDRLPPPFVEQTPLGREIFTSIVAASGTGSNTYYTKAESFPNTLATIRANPDALPPLPKFLERQEIPVLGIEAAEDDSAEETDADEVIKRRVRKMEERMEQAAKEQSLLAFLSRWKEAAGIERSGRECGPAWWIERWKAKLERSLHALEEKERRITNPKGKEAVEKTRLALEKKLARIEDAIHSAESVSAKNKEENIRQTTELLMKLQDVFRDDRGNLDKDFLIKELGPEAHTLFYRLMRAHAPTVLRAAEEADALPERNAEAQAASLRAWSNYFYEEYLAHFSWEKAKDEDDQEKPHEIQVPPELVELMHFLWRTKGIAATLRKNGMSKSGPPHPLASAIKAYKTLAANRDKILAGDPVYEPMSVMVSPCMGVGRALAGDTANACYSKLRHELAKGGYPHLFALLFSIPGKEGRIAGNVLCIDARNTEGKRVLVIRALNPTEAVIRRELEPVSFVKAVADYYIRAAQQSQKTDPADPVMAVHICVSPARQHLTNRDPISDAVYALLGSNGEWSKAKTGNGLKATPETAFNGHDIWRNFATSIIWERKP